MTPESITTISCEVRNYSHLCGAYDFLDTALHRQGTPKTVLYKCPICPAQIRITTIGSTPGNTSITPSIDSCAGCPLFARVPEIIVLHRK